MLTVRAPSASGTWPTVHPRSLCGCGGTLAVPLGKGALEPPHGGFGPASQFPGMTEDIRAGPELQDLRNDPRTANSL